MSSYQALPSENTNAIISDQKNGDYLGVTNEKLSSVKNKQTKTNQKKFCPMRDPGSDNIFSCKNPSFPV